MSTSLTQVIGTNTRTLRLAADVTAEKFAAVVAKYGLPWSSGRVGDLEHGRIASPELATVYALAAALGDVIGRPVALPELLATTEPVTVNDLLTIEPPALLGPVVAVHGGASGKGTLTSPVAPVMEADHRACRAVPIDSATGIDAMINRWGQPLSAERDKRAGSDANAQTKGIITRRLLSELREELGL
jgi:transcriptional regulator with XRE-family HTH domain